MAETPKKCPYCGRTFPEMKELTLHIVTRHTRRFSVPNNNTPRSVPPQEKPREEDSPARAGG